MTETKFRVSHTGKDSPAADLLNFRLAASEFLLTHDVWTGDKDYKRLGKELEEAFGRVYELGRSNMLAEIVRNAIDERTKK